MYNCCPYLRKFTGVQTHVPKNIVYFCYINRIAAATRKAIK